MAQSKGPEFPGGEEKLEQFLKENVHYPYILNSRKAYNVKAEVLVAEDGSVSFFDILKPRNPKRELIYEIKRIIKMMPNGLLEDTMPMTVPLFLNNGRRYCTSALTPRMIIVGK